MLARYGGIGSAPAAGLIVLFRISKDGLKLRAGTSRICFDVIKHRFDHCAMKPSLWGRFLSYLIDCRSRCSKHAFKIKALSIQWMAVFRKQARQPGGS